MQELKKVCIKCGGEYLLDDFPRQKQTKDGHGNICRECANKHQREKRKADGNTSTHKYEKTKKGFLMREYRNMKSRVTGVQKQKAHLYLGKPLLPREMFYAWALASPEFHSLFKAWENSHYERVLCPSVDRMDSDKGYVLSNMEWVTHSENSRRGSVSYKRKRHVNAA